MASLDLLVSRLGVDHEPRVFAIEATGSLHRAWASELERRHPGTVRVFARSETTAARAAGVGAVQDRRPGLRGVDLHGSAGRGPPMDRGSRGGHAAAVVRHRHGLVADRKVIQQRLHDQLNALAPGLSAPAGHGRGLAIEAPGGQAVLACAAAFAGRAPTVRLAAGPRPGRFTDADARYWAER